MILDIQAIQVEPGKKLSAFIESELERFTSFRLSTATCQVFLRYDKTARKKPNVVEVKIHSAGTAFFAGGSSDNFEHAFHLGFRRALRQLKKKFSYEPQF